MNKNFTITFDNNQAIVSSMNYLRIEDYMQEVVEELNKMKYEGKVLFDLLLCNGFAQNRFVEIDFNYDGFNIKSAKIIIPTEKMVKERNDHYRKYPKNVKEGHILSKSAAFLLLKGKDFYQKHI